MYINQYRAKIVAHSDHCIYCNLIYSGTPELRTLRNHTEVSAIGRCPLYGKCTQLCEDHFQSLHAT